MTTIAPPLADPVLLRIVEAIVGQFAPRRIVLFGSRARGDARPDSDYDLFVEMESDLPPRARAVAIGRMFPDRLWSLDVLVYTPDEVRRHRGQLGTVLYEIERDGRVLHERP